MTRNRLAVWIGPLLGLLSVSCAQNNKSAVAYQPAPPPSSTATPIRSAQPGMVPPRAEVQPAPALVQAEEPAAANPDEQIWAALERVIPEVLFEGVPFKNVIEWLRDELAINIHVHWRVLQEAGVSADAPVTTAKLRGLTAQRLLRLVLAEVSGNGVDLASEVDEDVLVISTSDYFGTHLVTRLYNTRDLIQAIEDGQNRENQENRRGPGDELLYGLIEMVEPNMWVQNGGLSTVQVLNDFLIVRAPKCVHRQVEGFLCMLREAGVGGSE